MLPPSSSVMIVCNLALANALTEGNLFKLFARRPRHIQSEPGHNGGLGEGQPQSCREPLSAERLRV
jgi:hypothetical protein